jgi:hypothetical protein
MIESTYNWEQIGDTIARGINNERFGYSVSSNGDGTIVAIGMYTSNIGVYKYNYITKKWEQLGQLIDITNLSKVSLNCIGNIIAIGDSTINKTTLYNYNATINTWEQLGQIIYGEAPNDQSGWSVSLNSAGTIVAIGSLENDGVDTTNTDRGHVRVYEYNSSSQCWVQLGQDIDGEAAGDKSGWSVSLNSAGTIVAIGSLENDGVDTTNTDRGHVRVYEYNSSSQRWVQLGQDIDGEAAGDNSGYSVSLNSEGNIVAIGAILNSIDTNNPFSGHTRVYKYNSSLQLWIQLGQDIDGDSFFNNLGYSVSLNKCGTIVAIGAPNYLNNINIGYVHVYEYNSSSNTWIKIGQTIDGEASGDRFGTSVSLNNNGGVLVIGAPEEGPGDQKGFVKVYSLDCTTTKTLINKQVIYPGKITINGSVKQDINCE